MLGISVATLLNGEEIEDEKIILRLASIIKTLKNNIKMLWVIFAGLALCNLPELLLKIKVISDFSETSTFFSGMLNGAFTGLQIGGGCFFVAGIASIVHNIKK